MIISSTSIQRGVNLVKTIVQPKLLSSYLVEVPEVPTVEVAVSVPLLQLPGMDDELTGGTTHLEPGAAGMLQVRGTEIRVRIQLGLSRLNRNSSNKSD